MKYLILAAFLAFAAAAPTEGPFVSVTEDGLGSYSLNLKSDDHVRSEQRSQDGQVTGYYAYFDEMGKKHVVHYTAGPQGFVPISADLPVAPLPVPDSENEKLRAMHMATWEKTAALHGVWDEDKQMNLKTTVDNPMQFSLPAKTLVKMPLPIETPKVLTKFSGKSSGKTIKVMVPVIEYQRV